VKGLINFHLPSQKKQVLDETFIHNFLEELNKSGTFPGVKKLPKFSPGESAR
jgi:hypothetical protein